MQELITEQVKFVDLRKLIQYFYFLAKITIFAGILQLQQAT